MSVRAPGGKPIANVTTANDVRWALDKARRYVFKGGDSSDPRYVAYIDRWLDFYNDEAAASPVRAEHEQAGT